MQKPCVTERKMSALTNETSMFMYLRAFLSQVAAFLDNICPLQRKLLVSAHNIKFFREILQVPNDLVGVDESYISRPFAKALQHS